MNKPLPGPVDFALLATLAAFWGGSFMLIKLALDAFTPAQLTASRLMLAAIVLGVVARWYGEALRLGARDLIFVALVGLFGNALPFVLISWGETTVDAGLAAILMGIMPLATLVMAHVFAGEQTLNAAKIAGVCLGLAGLVVLVGPHVLGQIGRQGLAQLAILAAALSYGVSAILSKQLLHLPRRVAGAAVVGAGAAMALALAVLEGGPVPVDVSARSLAAVLLLAAFPTALAAILVFVVLERQGAGFFGLVNLLVPLFGVAWAFLVLGEVPGPSALLALVLILGGIATTRVGPAARAASHPTRGISP